MGLFVQCCNISLSIPLFCDRPSVSFFHLFLFHKLGFTLPSTTAQHPIGLFNYGRSWCGARTSTFGRRRYVFFFPLLIGCLIFFGIYLFSRSFARTRLSPAIGWFLGSRLGVGSSSCSCTFSRTSARGRRAFPASLLDGTLSNDI